MPLILSIKTKQTQTHNIKQIIDTLNALLTDCNMTFYPKVREVDSSESDESEGTVLKEGGIVIKEVNKTSSILVNAKLNANEFDEYYYNYPQSKITVGVNLGNLLKCLKCMSNLDILTLQIDSDDINKLILILESAEKERYEKKTFKLNLMDLDVEKYKIKPVEFPFWVDLLSSEFHKNCKDMQSASEKINITVSSDTVNFLGKGELGLAEFELPHNGSTVIINKNDNSKDTIVQGLFELKNLLIFTKCYNLSDQVILYLKNDYPLVVKYEFEFGEMKLVLSPSKPN
jgi:proliferating cell nuclear antigen